MELVDALAIELEPAVDHGDGVQDQRRPDGVALAGADAQAETCGVASALHNGTFRGNNLAFVSARAALDLWRDEAFLGGLRRNADLLRTRLADLAATFGHGLTAKGRGMIRGIELSDPALAQQVKAEAFRRRLVLETCGPTDSVVKLMPALTIDAEVLSEGLDILGKALGHVLAARPHQVHGERGRRPATAPATASAAVAIDV